MNKSSLSPLQLSWLIHLSFVAGYFLLKINVSSFFKEKINFEVIDYPKAVPAQLNLQAHVQPKIEEKPPEPVQKKVFGVSRKAITTNDSSEKTAEIKQGNTVAKENDNLKLEKDDPDSIPIPADDYLVTSQVALERDIKIPYPPEAKKKNIEGPVVMDLIIDQNGKVRAVQLIRGSGSGLDEAALEAVKSFEFRPAQIGPQKVAVKIRYTYRFILENR